MPRINSVTIDSSQAVTDMCRLGTEFPTDKSPYSQTMHRHPYTAVYDMLFSTLRYQDICFGEVGVLDNMSMHMWRCYFPNAHLCGFEFDDERLNKAKNDALPDTTYYHVDVSNSESLYRAFNQVGRRFDVLIDDSTHLFEHQINFANAAIEFVKPGGLIIIEDIFKHWPNERYEEALAAISPYLSSSLFIETSHRNAYSGGNTVEPYYDNDKLLVLVKGQEQRRRQHPQRTYNLSGLPVQMSS